MLFSCRFSLSLSLWLAIGNSLNVMIQMFFFRFATYFSAVASYLSCYHCHKNHSTNIFQKACANRMEQKQRAKDRSDDCKRERNKDRERNVLIGNETESNRKRNPDVVAQL